jgi:hypothetical protein
VTANWAGGLDAPKTLAVSPELWPVIAPRWVPMMITLGLVPTTDWRDTTRILRVPAAEWPAFRWWLTTRHLAVREEAEWGRVYRVTPSWWRRVLFGEAGTRRLAGRSMLPR